MVRLAEVLEGELAVVDAVPLPGEAPSVHPAPGLLRVGRPLGLAGQGDLVARGLVVLLVGPLDQHRRVLDDDAHGRRGAGAPMDVHRLAGVVAGVLVTNLW